jgi:RNA polymerase sigma factor (TIGR02999 family)
VIRGTGPPRPGEGPGLEKEAAAALVARVYAELHGLAHHLLARESPGQLFQTTALVHEAYLRLVGHGRCAWANQAHFFAAAAQAMRRILVDQARQRRSAKRGGKCKRVSLDETAALAPEPAEDLLALDEALTRLEQRDPRQGQIVMLRYFAGLSVQETAGVLGVSPATVKADWSWAKAWLHREIAPGDQGTREVKP